jgi:hypothetical protein
MKQKELRQVPKKEKEIGKTITPNCTIKKMRNLYCKETRKKGKRYLYKA